MKLAQVVFDLVFERRDFDDVAVFEPSSVETYDVAVSELCSDKQRQQNTFLRRTFHDEGGQT